MRKNAVSDEKRTASESPSNGLPVAHSGVFEVRHVISVVMSPGEKSKSPPLTSSQL